MNRVKGTDHVKEYGVTLSPARAAVFGCLSSKACIFITSGICSCEINVRHDLA